jgi:uncharacterized protein (TIGR03435 family)
MDHLNALARQFAGEPVVFLAIAADERTTVERFLEHKPSAMWIGIDTVFSTFSAYHAAALPHTVLVNRDGVVTAITSSKNVTARAIRDLLAGNPVDLPLKTYPKPPGEVEDIAELPEDVDAENGYRAVVRASTAERGRTWLYGPNTAFENRRITFFGLPPRIILAESYGLPLSRVVDESGIEKATYDVDVLVPKGKEEELMPTLRHLVMTNLGIAIVWKTQEMEVQKLRLVEGRPPALQPSRSETSSYRSRGPSMEAVNKPISVLVGYLNNFSRVPVIDATGLTGTYDFAMEWTLSAPGTLKEALENLGLELFKTSDAVEALVIRPTGPASRGTSARQ